MGDISGDDDEGSLRNKIGGRRGGKEWILVEIHESKTDSDEMFSKTQRKVNQQLIGNVNKAVCNYPCKFKKFGCGKEWRTRPLASSESINDGCFKLHIME